MNIEQLFSIQTLFVSFGVGVLVSMFKAFAETRWVTLSLNKYWGKVWLPSIAILIGMLISLCVSVQPDYLAHANTWDKLIQGIIAGFVSSYIFRIGNSFLAKEAGDK